jgi:hypothetical protein
MMLQHQGKFLPKEKVSYWPKALALLDNTNFSPGTGR